MWLGAFHTCRRIDADGLQALVWHGQLLRIGGRQRAARRKCLSYYHKIILRPAIGSPSSCSVWCETARYCCSSSMVLESGLLGAQQARMSGRSAYVDSIVREALGVHKQHAPIELLKTNTRMFVPPKLKKTIEKKPVDFLPEPYQEREVLGIYHAVDAVTDIQFSEKSSDVPVPGRIAAAPPRLQGRPYRFLAAPTGQLKQPVPAAPVCSHARRGCRRNRSNRSSSSSSSTIFRKPEPKNIQGHDISNAAQIKPAPMLSNVHQNSSEAPQNNSVGHTEAQDSPVIVQSESDQRMQENIVPCCDELYSRISESRAAATPLQPQTRFVPERTSSIWRSATATTPIESEYAARFVWSSTVAAEAFHSRSSRRAHQHSLDLSHGVVPSPPPPPPPPPPHQQQQQQPNQQDCNVLSIEANSPSTFVVSSHQEQPKHEALSGISAAESRSSIANRIQQQVSASAREEKRCSRKRRPVTAARYGSEYSSEICSSSLAGAQSFRKASYDGPQLGRRRQSKRITG